MIWIGAFIFLGIGIAHIDDASEAHLRLAYASLAVSAILMFVGLASDYIERR